MKQFAGLALIIATMLAGCMDNTSAPVAEAPAEEAPAAGTASAVYNTRELQTAFSSPDDIWLPEAITDASTAPDGTAHYSGVVQRGTSATVSYSGSITGALEADADFTNNTLTIALSDFFDDTGSTIAGSVTIEGSLGDKISDYANGYTNLQVIGSMGEVDVAGASVTNGVSFAHSNGAEADYIYGHLDLYVAGSTSLLSGDFIAATSN